MDTMLENEGAEAGNHTVTAGLDLAKAYAHVRLNVIRIMALW